MRRALACAAVLAGLVVAAPATADLSTYGYSNSRTGADPAPAGVGTGSVAHMRVAWKTRLDGAINGQPLILDGVRVGQRIRDVVLCRRHRWQGLGAAPWLGPGRAGVACAGASRGSRFRLGSADTLARLALRCRGLVV